MTELFALTPGQGFSGVLDYSTHEARKFYSTAVKPLEMDNPFDVLPEGLHHFLKMVTKRAEDMGWSKRDHDANWEGQGILQIPDNVEDEQSKSKTLTEDYGQVSLDKVCAYSETMIDQGTRDAQDIRMLYSCLMDSLSKEGKDKVMVWEKDYKVLGFPCGISLLKVIIRESYIDTNATSLHIRTQLSSLDTLIGKIGHDITKFNARVKMMMESLAARGETTNDLIINLFKAYKVVPDKAFVKYIVGKEEKYEEGQELNHNSLMKLADIKFKTLQQKGQWQAPSPDEEKIVALEAKLKSVEGKLKRKGDEKKGDDGTHGYHKKGKYQKIGFKPLPDWMKLRPPMDRLNVPRRWNNKQWWYCHPDTGGKCNGVYRIHKPSECKGRAPRHKSKRKTENDKDKDSKSVRFNDALTALMIHEE